MQSIPINKWVPDLAYVIGLLVTDGCLSSDGRHIIFTSQDIEAIDNFRKILHVTNSIGKTINSKSEAYRVQVGSVKFYRWLLKIGLTPHKSLTIGSIDIPNKYFTDFLRGHLDGDGSITTYLDKYNMNKNIKYVYKRLWVRLISGSQEHVLWLQNKIIETIHVHGRIHATKKNSVGNSIYVLKFAKKESLILLKEIYYSENLHCLSRKRLIYENFIKSK
jgi:hypothetical protein